MATQRCYMASDADDGQRLDVLLGSLGLYPSRSAAAKAIDGGLVLVAGAPAAKKTLVKAGQAIVYTLDEPEPNTPLIGQAIPLDVRYEDEDLLVLSKQAGLICHPSEDHRDHTLVHGLINRYGARGLCSVQGEADRLGLVHRLDMDTSGLMLAAKTDEAGLALMDAIADRSVDRHYLALVHGIIPGDTGMIDAPIARHPKDRLRMAIRDSDGARDAITTFTVLKRYGAGVRDNGYTLVDCKLFTGRTHQIRVHMEYIKHPLVGDPLYTAGKPKAEWADLALPRQFLHSYHLGFVHPITGEFLEFNDNLPKDLATVLESLEPALQETTEDGRKVEALLADAPTPSIEGIPWACQ